MRRDASSPSVREREDLQTTAIDAARLAGEVLLEYARTGFHVEYKNAVNLVTDADRRAEQVIVDTIHRAYPDHSVLAEERGMEPGRDHLTGGSSIPWMGRPILRMAFPSTASRSGLNIMIA